MGDGWMYKSNLKVAIRKILKHKGYSLINIVGLAIGTACCLLLFLWVQDELSYDRYHEKAKQIFRVAFQYEANLKVRQYAGTPAPLGPALVREFPWIQKIVRFGYQNLLVKCNNKLFYEKIFFTDPEVFDVFTFPLAIGDTNTVLKDPHSILISEEIKSKYFDRENPMGKTISLRDWGDFIITGVFKDIPRNSHFRFDFLGCFANFAKINFDQWGMYNYTTYILIANESPIDSFKERMPQFIDKYIGKEKRKDYAFTYFLQPLTGIHLHSNIGGEIEPNRDIGTVYIFSAAAMFILLIACLNYINLTAARFAERAKEVGLRKVLGAVPAQLIRQFFSESFLYALSSLPLAILLAEIFLPLSNSLWGKTLSFHYFDNPFFLAGLTGIILFVGLVTGLVPALFLSALQPIDALKGRNKSGSVLTFLRRRLVVFQFTVSVLAIISTLVMVKQLHYVKTTDLGLNKENIINIAINNSEEAMLKYETIKYDFLQHPNVQAVSASCFFPGQPRWNMNYIYEGLDERKNNMTGCIPVDYDFIDTFKLNIMEGRGFSKEYPTDETNAFIVNEAARKEFGWDTPIGKELNIANWKKGNIIGVVKDFHFNSLHQKIGPAVLYIEPPHFEYFSVRVNL